MGDFPDGSVSQMFINRCQKSHFIPFVVVHMQILLFFSVIWESFSVVHPIWKYYSLTFNQWGITKLAKFKNFLLQGHLLYLFCLKPLNAVYKVIIFLLSLGFFFSSLCFLSIANSNWSGTLKRMVYSIKRIGKMKMETVLFSLLTFWWLEI